MAAKAILVFCASVLLTKTAYAQCIGRAGLLGVPYELAYGSSYGCGDIAASYGGGLAVTSTSPFPPTGLMVNSENAIDGTVAVIGNLPFLSSVTMEGVFPTAGAGSVSYGCGDGYMGIISELPAVAPVGYVDYGMAPYGVSYGGCGYGPMY